MSLPLSQNEALDRKPAVLILVERFPHLQPLAGELNPYKGTLLSFYEGGHTNKQVNKKGKEEKELLTSPEKVSFQ